MDGAVYGRDVGCRHRRRHLGFDAKDEARCAILVATTFTITSRYLGPTLWPWFLAVVTVFWLVTTSNAFNLIDSLDGLACSIGIIACSAVFAASILDGNRERAMQAAALGEALRFLAV